MMKAFSAIWHSEANSTNDLFKEIGARLIDAKVAKSSFIEALITREAAYPTGLDFGHIQVALPHADCDHILHPGFLLVRHAHPITFQAMGDANTPVITQCSLWPLVRDPNTQVETLGKLIELFQDPGQANILINGDSDVALATLAALNA